MFLIIGGKAMEWKRGSVFLIAPILFALIMMSYGRAEAGVSGCYFLYYDESCGFESGDDNYKHWARARIGLIKNGDVMLENTANTSADKIGRWFQWGKSLYIYIDKVVLPFGCKEFFSGSLQDGFWTCTDPNAPMSIYLAGCWNLEKLNMIKLPKNSTPEEIKELNCPWFLKYPEKPKSDSNVDPAIESDDEVDQE